MTQPRPRPRSQHNQPQPQAEPQRGITQHTRTFSSQSQDQGKRTYFVPNNLPTQPTVEEIQALEQYFGSHITNSSETLPSHVPSRPQSSQYPPGHPQGQSQGQGPRKVPHRPGYLPPPSGPLPPNNGIFPISSQQQQTPFPDQPQFQFQPQTPAARPPLDANHRRSGLSATLSSFLPKFPHPFHFPAFASAPPHHPGAGDIPLPKPAEGAQYSIPTGDYPFFNANAPPDQGGAVFYDPVRGVFVPIEEGIVQDQAEFGAEQGLASSQSARVAGGGVEQGGGGLLHPDSARLPGEGGTPESESPSQDFDAERHSLAPSESLSQSAVRRAREAASQEKLSRQQNKSTGGTSRKSRRNSTGGSTRRSRSKERRERESQADKQERPASMQRTQGSVMNWAGNVQGGRPETQYTAAPVHLGPPFEMMNRHLAPEQMGSPMGGMGGQSQMGMQQPGQGFTPSQMGETNVDQMYGDDSPPGGLGGGQEADARTIRSKAGTGWSAVYPPSTRQPPTLPAKDSTIPPAPVPVDYDYTPTYAGGPEDSPSNEGPTGEIQGGPPQSVGAGQYGWESPIISEAVPESDEVSLMDRMTLGARSGVTGMTGMNGVPFSTMSRMRGAMDAEMDQIRKQEAKRARKALEKERNLNTTKANMTGLQAQVRDLQARIIAEQVTRNDVERQAMSKSEEVRSYRDELAGAVRALRRSKEETRKLDEERKKSLRLYEETRERLVKLSEMYKVKEAHEAGRDEGRLEAFDEIARWMSNPPIPVEPLAGPPNDVLHPNQQQQQQTYPGYAPSPIDAAPHPSQYQQQQPPQHHQQGPSPRSQAPRPPQPHPLQHAGQGQGHHQRGFTPQSENQNLGGSAERLYQQAQNASRQGGVQGTPSMRPGQGPPVPHGMPPMSMAGHNAASSYLDRVDHNPRMEDMLRGAPARTFTMPSQGPTRGAPSTMHGRDAQMNGSVLSVDKPLPSPNTQSRMMRASTMPSRAGHSRQGTQDMGSATLGPDGFLSPNSRQRPPPSTSRTNLRTDKGLSQADRYPAFPVGRHQESILDHAVPMLPPDGFDPRSIALPDSRDTSEHASFAQHHPQRGPPLASHVSARTNKTARSRLAAGLRGEEDPLSMIEERDERETLAGHSARGPERMPLPASTVGRTAPNARSMHSFFSGKSKPQLVMPGLLAQNDIPPATATTADPNPHGMYLPDQASRHTATLPDARSAYRPEKAHSMYLPPELAQHVNGQSSIGNNGGRHNAPTINILPPSRSTPGQSGIPLPNAMDRAISPSSAQPVYPAPGPVIPADIPLPPTRPGTFYDAGAGKRQSMAKDPPLINIIDFAQRQPLPDSRPTTIFSQPPIDKGGRRHLAATVEDESEAYSSQPLPSILKRDGPRSAGPRPGRRKTSTFVTIDDVPRHRD